MATMRRTIGLGRSLAVGLVAAALMSTLPTGVHVAQAGGGGDGIVDPYATAVASYDPATDPYSMASIAQAVGADAWWNAGYTGTGVDVAVIDSGVSPVPGLDTPGKIVYGADLSLESQAANLTHLDSYGHGTFMAGLIAGQDADGSPTGAGYRGIAPGARIVSLKVATADGGTDVTQVIAAIDWVVQHKNDNGMNIRVLNLSYGTDSTQRADSDPLSFAVEQAWKAGIVVVVAAGNDGRGGEGQTGLSNPARNPFVIAVGGSDTKGNQQSDDDDMGDYSSEGKRDRKPDLVAPGTNVQGLRVPNSFLDATHPNARRGDRYFRGSGTSQAAAITSGAVALVLQKHPQLTPDQVKEFLVKHARKMGKVKSELCGKGGLQLQTMLDAKLPKDGKQKAKSSKGGGSIDEARGSARIAQDGVVLSGEVDIFGRRVDSRALASQQKAWRAWSGGSWNGSSWSGSSWSGSSWSGSSWSGSSWSGSSWSGSSWSGSSWSGSSWSGSSWSGSSWSGSSWSGSSWSGSSWSGSGWSGSVWSTARWG